MFLPEGTPIKAPTPGTCIRTDENSITVKLGDHSVWLTVSGIETTLEKGRHFLAGSILGTVTQRLDFALPYITVQAAVFPVSHVCLCACVCG